MELSNFKEDSRTPHMAREHPLGKVHQKYARAALATKPRGDVMMDGGIQRGTHVLKALSLGAKAVGIGRYYLFALAAAGQAGVEQALGLMRTEIERDMRLMGCSKISQLSRANLRFR
jgi:L-lactate dehydrogenase (cytochrome)